MSDAYIFFKEGKPGYAPILMLHGTGGGEEDLVNIADFLSPNSPKLGIRGRLIENGRTRYFNHTEDGGFDLDSLDSETDWLLETIKETFAEHHLDPTQAIVVGYSNGANIAAYSWLNGKDTPFRTAILFHPMLLTDATITRGLDDIKVWDSYGANDQIVSPQSFFALNSSLKVAGAQVTSFQHQSAHKITDEELTSAKKWINQINLNI